MNFSNDPRTIFTLDAGGTNYVFTAIKACQKIGEQITLPAEADNLDKSITNIKRGFAILAETTQTKPSAISFAFPGPADYENGVIFNIGNIPAFAGGVALADILQNEFNVPVFINNDGDLFAYGEAMVGTLPSINQTLKSNENPKRYKNIFGITLGTGLGGGFVIDGKLYTGDNSNASEIWLMKNKYNATSFAEESACIRAIQKSYAKYANIDDYKKYSPKDIEDIAFGKLSGNIQAAQKAYEDMGEALGDILCEIIRITDSIVVIGGGLSYGYKLFMPSLIKEMNAQLQNADGKQFPKLVQKVYNLEDETQLKEFATGGMKEVKVYGSTKTIFATSEKRVGVCISKLGASNAVAVGAYAFALNKLDNK